MQKWRLLNGVRLSEDIPDYFTLLHRKLFSGDSVYYKRHRRDRVLFISIETIYICLTEPIFAFYRSSLPSNNRFVVILILDQTHLEHGTTAVVHQLRHQRYKFSVPSTAFIHTVFVHPSRLLQPVMVVIYLFCLKQTHGIYKRFDDICDDSDSQASIRFLD